MEFRSRKSQLGMVLVDPITQGGNNARFEGFTVSLMGTGRDTQGVVLIDSVRMMDLEARKAIRVKSAPVSIVDEATAILIAILEG